MGIVSGLLHSTYHDHCPCWIYCHFAKHHCNNYQSCGYHCHVVITIIKYHQHLSLSKIFNSQSFASGLPNTSSIGGDSHGNQPPTSSTDVKICQDAPRIWGTDLTAWQRNASAEAWGGFPKITKSLSGKPCTEIPTEPKAGQRFL